MKHLIFILITLLPFEAFASWSVWTETMLVNKPQPTYNPTTKPTSIALKGAKTNG